MSIFMMDFPDPRKSVNIASCPCHYLCISYEILQMSLGFETLLQALAVFAALAVLGYTRD